MSQFKEAFESIDFAIGSGAVSSVDMLQAIMYKASSDTFKRRLLCYILEYHMDEEMELFLQDTMGYDPMLHRIQVSLDGTISF
jgi:hypothetical protein